MKSSSAVSENAKNQGIAEARFMRSLAYWYLASLWGNVILYENTSDLVNHYVVPTNPRADVMEFAIRDMEFAAKYLPTVAPETGRVNKYSAFEKVNKNKNKKIILYIRKHLHNHHHHQSHHQNHN